MWQVSVVELVGESAAQGLTIYGRGGTDLHQLMSDATTALEIHREAHPDNEDEERLHPLTWEVNVEWMDET